MTTTPNLALPYIDVNAAQREVLHNEAIRALDALVQPAVVRRDLTAPPGAPVDGQRWIVKATATGLWAGHEDDIAAWQDGAWRFHTPAAGWFVYDAFNGALIAWDGSAWVDAAEALGELQNLTLLGVGTAADSTNPFSARLNSTLWVARTVAEGGDGHLRYKLSKEAAAKTLSLLLQTNFSGRAEIELTGDDDLHVKVSADGSTWFEGLSILRSSGQVRLGTDGSAPAPALAFASDTDNGAYRIGANTWALSAGGTKVLELTATNVTVPVALAVTGAATLSSTLAVTGNVTVNTNKFTVTAASGNTVIAGTLDVQGATVNLASGAALNWNSGTVVLTQSSTLLMLTGASTLIHEYVDAGSAGATFTGFTTARRRRLTTSSRACSFRARTTEAPPQIMGTSGLSLSILPMAVRTAELKSRRWWRLALATRLQIDDDVAITSNTTTAFAVGRQGATSPQLLVNASAANVVTGISVTGAASGGGVIIAAISSATNEDATFDAKGTGVINIATGSTGQINLKRNTEVTGTLNAQSHFGVGTSFTDFTVTAGTGVVNCIGEYRVDGTKVVGNRDTGWTAMTGTANEGTSYATGTITVVQLAERVKAIQDALTTHGLIGA